MRTNKNTITVAECLSDAKGTLQPIVEHARRLQHLNHAFARFLGEPLAGHCRIANVHPDHALLHADTPVWSAKLRFQLPEILTFLREASGFPRMTHARIQVQPRPRPTRTDRVAHRTLSAQSASLIRSVAASCTDRRLKESLIKLSLHSEQ